MDFYQRVAVVCRRIPRGRVATYGQIALLCGKPRNARQVGYALKCRVSEPVPAYRVVNGQGCLSADALFREPGGQAGLLKKEGVEISEDRRVDLRRYGWQNTLDEALELRDYFMEHGI
ncbi:MAG: cysteine methyltransferase [Lachnospiraceae bacterium]|nr:cysteine methyltransferase [Lachnospiraceae bacterium]